MSDDIFLTSGPSVARSPLPLPLSEPLHGPLHALRAHPRPFILGASGGLDSSAAMLLLAHAQCPTLVVHVHHHLRADADNDLRIVQQQAQLVGFPMEAVHLTPPPSDSTENLSARSRRLRYDALTRFAAHHGADVLTAHHADDVIETTVMRWMRGAALAHTFGPKDTLIWNQQTVLRPFLSVWKKELKNLVFETGFPWIEDSSNAADSYTRNRIRKRMRPLIEELSASPKTARTLAELVKESAVHASRADDLPALEAHLSHPPHYLATRTQSPTDAGWIDRIEAMRTWNYHADAFQNALYHWCNAQQIAPRRDVLTQITHALWEGTPLQRDLQGLQLLVQTQGLILRRAPITPPALDGENQPALLQLHESRWTKVGALRLKIEENKDNIKVWARPWRTGDRMRSPHSERWVSVRKRLTRNGVPNDARDRAIVLWMHSDHDPPPVHNDPPVHGSTRHNALCAPHNVDAATHKKAESEPNTDSLRIVGVLYEHNQRLEIRLTPTMRVSVVSAMSAFNAPCVD